MIQESADGGFAHLGPDKVLNLVEKTLGIRCSNLFRPMNSYINRVYELETAEREPLIVKFYRPGRWNRRAIEEEHQFLQELSAQEIPVIAPRIIEDGTTLGQEGELLFGIFPKCGGRCVDEFTDDQWMQLGRLLGRTHGIGRCSKTSARPVMTPGKVTRDHLAYLEHGSLVPGDMMEQLRKVILEIVEMIEPLFEGVELIRIHGDCHFANVIERPGEGFYLIDFDDMVMGPPVQDIWMMLPGDISESFVEMDMFLEGYETFHPFDYRSVKLVEPLRAMRFIHYMAWCARQVEEDGVTRVIEDFGSRTYWQKEIDDLVDQKQRIEEEAGKSFGNMI